MSLPHINPHQTPPGIGATVLEAQAQRNWIVVQNVKNQNTVHAYVGVESGQSVYSHSVLCAFHSLLDLSVL